MQKLLSAITVPVSDEKRTQIESLLMEFRDIYAVHDNDSGCLRDYVHDIELASTSVRPISDKVRRFPLKTNTLIQQHLDQLEKAGVVKKGLSPWSSNVVPIIRRVEGSNQIKFRLATDLIKINAVSLTCQQPLPNAEREILNLRGQSVLSQLDFKAAFYVIILSEKSQKILSIRTEHQQYQFLKIHLALFRRLHYTRI